MFRFQEEYIDLKSAVKTLLPAAAYMFPKKYYIPFV
jgi:hypothetical protein